MTKLATRTPDGVTKTIDDYFVDWESTAFGFGYGTGEPHTIGALKSFFHAFGVDDRPDSYNYEKLEKAVTPAIAWLLINRLCQLNVIEYGTSPRYAWLTKNGAALRAYVVSKTADELVDLVCSTTEDSTICYPDACNCGPEGYEKGRICQNPFWHRRH